MGQAPSVSARQRPEHVADELVEPRGKRSGRVRMLAQEEEASRSYVIAELKPVSPAASNFRRCGNPRRSSIVSA